MLFLEELALIAPFTITNILVFKKNLGVGLTFVSMNVSEELFKINKTFIKDEMAKLRVFDASQFHFVGLVLNCCKIVKLYNFLCIKC